MRETNKKSLAAIFVRHGDTPWNAGEGGVERVRGQADIPLDESGRAEAQRLGRSIRQLAPAAVYSSPLSRATETAQQIAQSSGTEMQILPELLPWGKGQYEGQPIKEADPILDRYAEEKPDTPVPGGGEAYNRAIDRFRRGAKSILDMGRAAPGPVVAVTHSTNLRQLPHVLEGRPLESALEGGPDPGQMLGVSRAGKILPHLPRPR